MQKPLNYEFKEQLTCEAVRWTGNNADALYALAKGNTNILSNSNGVFSLTQDDGTIQPIEFGQWLVKFKEKFNVVDHDEFTEAWTRPPESLSVLPTHTPSVEQIFISGMNNRQNIKSLVMLAEDKEGHMMIANSQISGEEFRQFAHYFVNHVQLICMLEEAANKKI